VSTTQFVGRTQDLLRIAVALADPQPMTIPLVIVTGIGGIGKTSVAVEFAYRYGPYFQGGVFWMSCGDPRVIPGDVAACGVAMNLPIAGLPLDDQLAAVRRAWNEPLPRLLIFDNCEDPQVLRTWMPTLGGCRVLITTRRGVWPGGTQIPIGVLPREDSVALIQKLAAHVTISDADLLAMTVGDLPLAVHLAACYVARVQAHETPAQYLERLARIDLLTHPAFTGRALRAGEILPTGHEQHVARTFALSVDRLDPSRPSDGLVLHLLACLACLAPGAVVPWSFISDLFPAETDPLDRLDAREQSVALGLVDHAGPDDLQIHRLIHSFLQSAVPIADAEGPVMGGLVQHAAAINEHWDPVRIAPLLPHLRWRIAQQTAPNRVGILLLHALSDHEVESGAYAQALLLCQKALTWSEALLSSDDPLTVTSVHNLADILARLGSYDRALQYAERALHLRETQLGPDHLETAQSLSTLASILQHIGHYDEARRVCERALIIRETVLGPAHPTTALSMNNLGGVLQAQGDGVAAEVWYRRALQISTDTRGADHPTTAVYLHNLAGALIAQGDPAAARPLAEEALAKSYAVLGPMHPSTASRLNTLGWIAAQLHDAATARSFYEQSLFILETVLGPTHPMVAVALHNLALMVDQQGESGAARMLLERALSITTEQLGLEHPTTEQMRRQLTNCIQRTAAP
jgi:tetratricopeptide (TPR) repeat protein